MSSKLLVVITQFMEGRGGVGPQSTYTPVVAQSSEVISFDNTHQANLAAENITKNSPRAGVYYQVTKLY